MAAKPALPGVESPLESLGIRWESASRSRLLEILRKYGHRLTPPELRLYETAAASAAGGALHTIRSRLLSRLWLNATLKRQRLSVEFAPREGEFGPYNDRVALEDALQKAASADSLWVREYCGLYLRMQRLRTSFLALVPAGH